MNAKNYSLGEIEEGFLTPQTPFGMTSFIFQQKKAQRRRGGHAVKIEERFVALRTAFGMQNDVVDSRRDDLP